MNYFIRFCIGFAFLVLFQPASSWALEVNLSWDPNEEPNVAGYKLYYRAASPDLPLDGWEAVEGDSPVDVGDETSISLHLPDDGQVYYFAVTAYDTSGYESSYSNIVASEWVPALLDPIGGVNTGTAVTFTWSSPPEGSNYTFTLIYGTDSSLSASGTVSPFTPPVSPLPALVVVSLLGFLRIQFFDIGNPKKWLIRGLFCFFATLAVTGCGGGGTESGGTLPGSIKNPGNNSTLQNIRVVSDLVDTFYSADDLEPGRHYYWKVVAMDELGNEYQSVTGDFVTD